VDIRARPEMSGNELAAREKKIQNENDGKWFYRSAVLHFKSGNRYEGLLNGLRCLKSRPFVAKIWAIIFFGLAGKGAIRWLFRQKLHWELSKAGIAQFKGDSVHGRATDQSRNFQ
jgi:hypothetical protein